MPADSRLLFAALLFFAAGASGCGEGGRPAPAVLEPAPSDASPSQLASGSTPDAVAQFTGMPKRFENEWGMRFVIVPGGRYEEGDGPRGDVAARHEVNLWKAFYLQDAEVTRGQWTRFAGGAAPPAADADRPVTGVSYDEAEQFAKWLTAHDGHWTYRLPTEAEWDRAWLSGRERGDAADVTPWGLRGMASAPCEWCFDWFEPLPDWPVMSPRGPENGDERVLRPGLPEHLAGRRSQAPGAHDAGVGLRLAVSLGYGGDAEGRYGRYRILFRTRGGLPTVPDGPELPGYEIRIVAIIDRLMDRQIGRHFPWSKLPGLSSPLTAKLVPGIYYAQCQRVENGEMKRGMEVKFGVVKDDVVVDLPIPQEGGYLQEPE